MIDNISTNNFKRALNGKTPGAVKRISATGRRVCVLGRCLILIIFTILMVPAMAQAGWYDANWSNRQKITILPTLADADLTNFPYLVKITDSANPIFSIPQTDGDDILFTAADGTTKLNHEIEKYNPATYELYIWVQVPTISGTLNTDIYMYYGNGSATSQQSVAATWDNDFVMVQHLQETSGTHFDSTSQNNDGTPQNGVVQTATGKIDGADTFDGVNDYVNVPDSTSLRVVAMTLEAWVRIPAPLPSSGYHGILNHGIDGNANWYLLSYDGSINRFHYRWSIGSVRRTNFAATVSADTWYYVVGVLNAGTTTAYTYLNGGLDTTVTGASLPTATASTLDIGRSLSSELFKGTIDEVRISKVARTPEWISASFRNQNTPDTYQTLEPQQDPPSLWIGGRIFEDKNYGGGAGRSLAASSGVGRPGARVELYDASGAFVDSSTTNAQGDYTLGISSAGNYTVRVVNATVRSSRTGSDGTELSVQTFRTDASSGTAAPVTDKVGGEQPQQVDSPANNGSQSLATLQALPGQYTQSIAPVSIAAANITGVDFGFNFDTIVNTNTADQGSLRQFIRNANRLTDDATLDQAGRTPGRETSIFMIPTTDTGYSAAPLAYTIRPTAVLDDITDPVILDGTTQPGFSGSPIIEIDGTSVAVGDENGLTLQAGNSVVRGFVINRFLSDGIEIEIGGTNVVEGNYFGTDVAGTAARPNGYGISVKSNNNVIGGTTASQRNVISGNTGWGVSLYTTAANNAVRGNYIGLRATGATGLGNSGNGIEIYGTASSNNTIENNVIAGNAQDGVAILDGANIRNAILGNAIYGNGQLGIDLRNDGVTNNNGSINTGRPNYEMDFPVFTNVILDGLNLSVSGYIGSSPNDADFANARVEIFLSDNDPSGNGEGQAYLGYLTADASGNFSGSLTVSGLAVGNSITGTATDEIGNTSEFGANVVVQAHPCPGWTVSTTADTGVPGTLRECVKEANKYSEITLTVPAGTYTLAIAGDDEDAAVTGDLDITAGMTINGAGAGSTIIQAGTNSTNGIDRVFHVDPARAGGFTVSMSNMTIRYGRETGTGGGGILIDQNGTLSFTDGAVTGCNGKIGGGIASLDPSSLTLNRVTVNGNTSTSDGGGVYTLGGYQYTDVAVTGNTAANNGGGIFSDKGSGMFTAVTISGNQANNSRGGGIYSKGSGIMTLTNVTVSGNSASSEGGGICVDGNTSNLTNVTVYNNTGPTGSGIRRRGGTLALRNTIVAGNAAGNCSGMSSSYSSGYNLDDGATCLFTQTGDIQNQNPTFGALANNGGYTQTHALVAGSPAIDKGTGTGAPATDQRGVSRPIDGDGNGSALFDIGAYEAGPLGVTVKGTVFEDADFAGASSEYDGGTNDLALANVDVELYDNSDNHITSVTTDATGGYSFTGLSNGTYKVRVRSATIGDANTPPKGGLNATVPGTWPYPLAELAWANGGALYGGQDPTADDTATGDNAGPGDTYVTLTVNSDVSGVNFGFAFNLIVNTGDDTNADTVRSKQGSLRQFIKNANAIGTAGGTTANISQFRIPNGLLDGNGVASIAPLAALPNINDATGGTAIDGFTQTTNQGDTNSLGPEVEIRGFPTSFTYGLELNSANNTVKGLIINSFSGGQSAGIMITGASATGNTVTGNYLGTNYSGTAAVTNYIGVAIGAGAQSNTVGGTSDAERNVISGNSTYGAEIKDSGTDLNVVKGNYIGTDRLGTTAVANGTGAIIWAGAANNTIGGNAVDAGNVISGSTSNGLIIANPGSDNNVVQGNLIGTDAAGTGNLGNGSSGININQGALNNTIGGTATREANTIAFNSGDGISMNSSGTDGNKVSGNAIFQNGGLGIDLDPDGVGTGSGANNDKAAPSITSITPSGSDFTIIATAGNSDTIEFFRVNNTAAPAVTADPSGSGEGYLYLGSCVDNGACSGPHISAVADVDPAAGSVQAVLLSSGLNGTDVVTATATDTSNNTSEFAVNAYTSTCPGGVVTTTADAGFASLRECINLANSNPGTTISFNIPGPGNQSAGADSWWRISPTSALPTVTAAGTIIDATTQTVNQGDTNSQGPEIELNGGGAGASIRGLTIAGGNSTVRGLVINRFTLDGIYLVSFGGNVIEGNYIGTNATGTTDLGNSGSGVYVHSSTGNTIGGSSPGAGNLISGNDYNASQWTTGRGVMLYDADGNTVIGNYIGTDITGTVSIGNEREGVGISNCINNTVGGSGAGEGNLISGNSGVGVWIGGGGTTGNRVLGNHIGTQVDGTSPLGNSSNGVAISNTATDNIIGGSGTGEGNVIAYNTNDGVWVDGSTTDFNLISGNSIFENSGLGIDLESDGVGATGGANNNKAAPVITGIAPSGSDIAIIATAGSGDTVEFFRVDNAAAPVVTADPSGSGEGYLYLGSCVDNGACSGPHVSAVADADPAAGSVQAVLLSTGVGFGDTVTATATDTSSNTSEFAVNFFTSTCPGGVVTTTADSGFASLRECIDFANSNPGTTISFNIPDTEPGYQTSGTDHWWRITLASALPAITADGTTIDATTQTANRGDTNTQGPEVEINGNGLSADGLTINSASNTVRGFLITRFSSSSYFAVNITGAGATGNVVAGNYIGTNFAGTAADASTRNGYGIRMAYGAQNNTIGGTVVTDRNLISGNTYRGITISGTGTDSNRVVGNFIGTTVNGSAALPNGIGIFITSGANNNVIGGPNPGEGNTISGNTSEGIRIEASDGSVIKGNRIGTNAAGTAALANTDGIGIHNTSTSSVIGGASGAGNIISGNSRFGVWISGSGTDGHIFQGNLIGVDIAGTGDLGNVSHGIYISGGPNSNVIGGPVSGESNIIAFNGEDGIFLTTSTTNNNLISGNSIFENAGLGIDLDPDGVGATGGANNNKAAPVISGITPSGSDFTIIATAGNSDTIEFFRVNNPAAPTVTADPSGSGEGYLYLGSCVDNGTCSGPHISAVADADAAAGSVQAVLLSSGLSSIDVVTATATDTSSNTSEFAANAYTSTCPGGVVTTTADAGFASLRECINLANSNPGTTISFNIPGPGNQSAGADSWWRISPTSALPTVTAAGTIIDATTQTTNQGDTNSQGPEIELDGTNAGAAHGLTILTGGSSTVRGLVINRFTLGAGISISLCDGNTIQGNYIGTDVTGTVALGNSRGIILFSSSNNTIGGTSAAQRNVISGNNGRGIEINNASSSNNVIQGNYIGTDAAGTTKLANGTQAVFIAGPDNVIGGAAAGAGNILAAGINHGIMIYGTSATGNTVQGNFIGTDPSGVLTLDNSIGIHFGGGAANNLVGGMDPNEGNLIAFNATRGIAAQADAGSGNTFIGNAIYQNGTIGIDLGNNNFTVNDDDDIDTGPNDLLNFPVITSASEALGTVTIDFDLDVPAGNYRIEFFENPSGADPTGYGEGESFTSSYVITHSGSGVESFSHSFAGAAGNVITATTTECTNGITCTLFGSTSEFSVNAQVLGTADLALTKTANPDPAPAGGPLVYTLIVTNNGPTTANNVTLTDTLPAGVTFQSFTPSQGSCSGTATITCDFGAIFNGGTASVEILVVTSGAGTITNTASVSADETDPVPGNNSVSVDTEVVISPMSDVPLTQYTRMHGFIDYTTTGGTLRTQPNSINACSVTGSSTAALSGIPAGGSVLAAYLYWAGSGSTVDSQVTLDGASFTADRTFTSNFVLGATNYDFFGGFKDVTAAVQAKRNGNYTFSGLTVDTSGQYCGSQAVIAGWSLIVIYEDSSVSGKTLVVYDGFDLERNNTTSYLLSGIHAVAPTEAKTSFLLWEGDESLGGSLELLQFKGTNLSDALNPVNNVYNGTINSLPTTTAYGVDLDTFDVSSLVSDGDTSASNTVSVGPDLVILNAVVLEAKTDIIVGYVFDDVNYGGGAGRDFPTAAAAAPGFSVGRPGARAELYDAAGNFLRATTTDSNGRYGFAGIPNGNYFVRAVNDTVTPARSGATGSEWPVQTFRTDAGTGTPVAVTNEVGGASPAAQDDPANTTSANLSSLTAQSVAPVTIGDHLSVFNVDFGFNFDTIVNTNPSGQGSLREFIENANALSNTGLAQAGMNAGIENSIFEIPGAGPFSIQPATVLPTVTDPVVLDGTTQPGWTSAPIIELNGAGAGAGVNGITITAGGSTVQGLVVNRFTGNGIYIDGNGNNTIAGNYIGVNAAGTAAAPNNYGIYINSTSGNLIGGSAASSRNVISGNTWSGIRIQTGGSNNTIRGNYIGTNAAGNASLPNNLGINLMGSSGNTIGGTGAAEGNIISGNTNFGIQVADAANNVFQGNTIGLDPTRTVTIPNTSHGIAFNGASSPSGNIVGGAAVGAGNVISGNLGSGILIGRGTGNTIQANAIYGNGQDGVQALDGTGNAILTNSIYGNGWIGIDLGIDNVTPNDGAKTAGQPNLLMDFPVFTTSTLLGTNLYVSGYVGSASDQAIFANARVEIFEADNDASGHGEGQTFLGFLTTDGNGNFSGTIDVSGKGLAADDNITGTATDGSNNTSEFGAHRVVVTPAVTIEDITEIEGTGLEFTVTLDNAVSGGFDVTVGFTDGTATGGAAPLAEPEDYANDAVTLNFAGTASESQTFTVATLDDALVEGNEAFTVTLSASNANVDAGDTAVGTITENDTDLVVEKTVDNGTPDEGGTATFTVTVTNSGSVQVTNVSLDDELPPGLTIGTVTPSQGSWSDPTWTIGTINSGSSVTLTIEATVDAGTAGSTITNTVTNVALDQVDSNTTTDDLSEPITVGNSTDLVIGKTVDNGTPDEGDTVTFTVTVKNNGPARATSVSIDDVLPAGLTAGTITPSQGSYTAPTWTIGTIDAGSSFTLDITATVNAGMAGQTITNTVTGVALDQVDSNSTPDDLSESITFGAILIEFDSAAKSDDEATGGNIPQLLIKGTSASARTIDVTISGGTATDADDYTLTTTVNVPAGVYDGTSTTAITVPLTIIDDSIVEADETIIITLSNPGVGFSIGDADNDSTIQNSHTYIITNDDSAGVSVSAISGDTDESGTSATFSVVLTSQPTAPVTIDLTNGDTTEGSLDKASLIFDGANWNVAQTVTVTGVDDALADGDITYTVSLEAATSADASYNGRDPDDVSVTNLDDDSAGVSVSAISGDTDESGTSATFSVVLTSQPTAPVTIDLTNGDTTEGSLDKASLIFDGANWNVAQTVTVTGVDDALADGDITYTVSLEAATSADASYNGRDPDDVSVTNLDDDSAGVSVSAISGDTDESGTSATFSVVLTSQPTAPVTIDLTNGDTTEGSLDKASLIFDGANWNVAQTVTVTGVDDALADGDITYTVSLEAATSADASYNGRDPDDVSVTNLDDDSAGVSVSAISGDTDESGTSATFSVVLTSQPTAPVTIDLTNGDTTEGSLDKASLIFDGANWNVAQTVTVTGVDDALADGDITYTVSLEAATSADASYNGRDPDDVSVTNLDDDSAGVSVSAISGDTDESGTSATFSVVLTSQPTAPVTIDLTNGDTTEGSLDKASLIFDGANWNVAQTVTVTGVDDALADGDITYTVSLEAATSADASYNGRDPDDVSVTNLDDDSAGVSVSAISGDTDESGTSATFSVVLTSQPTAPVTIDLTNGDTTEGSLDKASLIFDGANWNVAQTVTVTGVDDALADGDITYTVSLEAATSADASYNGRDPDDVSVTNLDDDSAGVSVSAISGDTDESGTSATFSVVLTSQPTAPVTIDLTNGDTTEGSLDKASLIFDGANWNVAQTVTVTGVDDALADGDITYTVSLEAATSADASYNGRDPDDVSVTNLDDDSAGVSVSAISGDTDESGTSATFSVVLTSQPTAPVTIDLTNGDTTEGSLDKASLIFDGANWNVAQTVTVTGVDDALADGDITYTVSLEAATSADASYNGRDPDDVSVTNLDDDSAGVSVSAISGDTDESGTSATFSVVLTSQPTAPVTIDLTNGDTTEGSLDKASLIFDGANWNVAQTVTVTGVDDALADGDITYTVSLEAATSADASYNGRDPDDVSVTNLDDDSAGVSVSAISGDTDESGTSATFSVVLTSQPTAPVTIDLTNGDTTEGSLDKASLIFDGANWNVAQTVTVTGVDDALADGDITYTVSLEAATSADASYNGRDPDDVSVTNLDDDSAGVSVSAISGDTDESGTSATFSVVLTSQPTAPVTIDLTNGDTTEGSLDKASLIFDGANWNVAQTVTVTGVDDALADGDITYTVSLEAATSADASYNGRDPDDVSVTNLDDDSAGVSVSAISGDTDESGTSATFSVVLTSQPTAPVTIDAHQRRYDRGQPGQGLPDL